MSRVSFLEAQYSIHDQRIRALETRESGFVQKWQALEKRVKELEHERALAERMKAIMPVNGKLEQNTRYGKAQQNVEIIKLAIPLMDRGYTFKDACQAIRGEMSK